MDEDVSERAQMGRLIPIGFWFRKPDSFCLGGVVQWRRVASGVGAPGIDI